jgi:hypothetical protein
MGPHVQSADRTNYLLLEMYSLRERAERCRQHARELLVMSRANAAILSRTIDQIRASVGTLPVTPPGDKTGP